MSFVTRGMWSAWPPSGPRGVLAVLPRPHVAVRLMDRIDKIVARRSAGVASGLTSDLGVASIHPRFEAIAARGLICAGSALAFVGLRDSEWLV